MYWLSMNCGMLQGPCSSLGYPEGDHYVTGPNCLESLNAMERELMNEDIVRRNVRRSFGLSRIIQKDLVPMLVSVQDPILLASVVRLLVNLTLPVECLLPVHLACHTPQGQESVRQLQHFLLDTKKAFLEDRVTSAVVQSIREALRRSDGENRLSEEDCLHLNNMLLLVRNILCVPEGTENFLTGSTQSHSEWQSLQNKLVWNLFAQGLDVALLLLINNKYRVFWTVAIVQVIALLYKDQNISKIQQLFASASDISDSSEDDIDSDGSKDSILGSNSARSSCGKRGTPASDSGFLPSDDWSSRNQSSCSPPKLQKNSLSSSQNSSFDSTDSHHSRRISQNCSFDSNDGLQASENTICKCTTEEGFLKKSRCSNKFSKSLEVEDFKSEVRNNLKRDGTDINVKVEEMVTSDWEQSSSSAEELKQVFKQENLNVVHKHKRRLSKITNESDSSNDDEEVKQMVKARSHPPVGWKCKGITEVKFRRCSSSICLEAAQEVATSKGRHILTKEAILDKRRKVQLTKSYHTPTEEEISILLKEFTLRFLHNGYADIVLDLKKVMTAHNALVVDKSHFLWLLTYFLRQASAINLDYRHLRSLLSAEVIGYMTYEGVMMCEELQLLFHSDHLDPKPLIARLQLLVTTFHELFSTIDKYSKKSSVKLEKQSFQELKVNIAEMLDVRQLFLLLIRNYNSTAQSKQYLCDVISTNHVLLLLLESIYIDPEYCERLDLSAHIKQFATIQVMEQYGVLLEDFKVNSEFVNNCLFTMMHHVVGEGKSTRPLFQPHILKTFCAIMEDDGAISEVWEDLMNFTLSEFTRTAERGTGTSVSKLFGQMTVNSDCGETSASSSSVSEDSEYSVSMDAQRQNEDSLYWWYLQFQHHSDVVGSIQEGLPENHKFRTRKQLLQELLTQGIVNQDEYDNLKCKEIDETQERNESNSEDRLCLLPPWSERDSTFQLIRELITSGFKPQIEWLQRVILEACYVKAGLQLSDSDAAPEPVIFFSHQLHQSLPLVPYSDTLDSSLQNPKFTELLHALVGFHLPKDVGKVFPRIPSFWTVDALYAIALRLGPLSQQKGLKFKPSRLKEWIHQLQSNSDEMKAHEESQRTTPKELPKGSISGSLHKEPILKEMSHFNSEDSALRFTNHSPSGMHMNNSESSIRASQRRQSFSGYPSLASNLAQVGPSIKSGTQQRRESYPGTLYHSPGIQTEEVSPFGYSQASQKISSNFISIGTNLNWMVLTSKSKSLLPTANTRMQHPYVTCQVACS